MAQDFRTVAVPATESLVALRHSARHLSFFPRRQALAPLAGNYRSRFRGRGMDFEEVRPYQPGDDVRIIDWRVTARTNQAYTKVFREERERPVLIAVDLRTSMLFGSVRLKSVVAAEVAATLAWAGLNANDRVGGLVFTPQGQRDTRSHRSHHTVLQFIRQLAGGCGDLISQQTDKLALSQVLEDIHRVVSPGTSLVIISDFQELDKACEKQLHALARHCEPTLVAVRDPLELELPPPASYVVSDGTHRRILDAGNSSLREQFHTRQLRQQQQLESLAYRLGAGLLRISTNEAFMPELIRHYGANNRRRR